MSSQPSPLLRSLFSRSASNSKTQHPAVKPCIPSFTLPTSASKPPPPPDPQRVSAQLLRVAHLLNMKIRNAHLFGFVKLEQLMKKQIREGVPKIPLEKESVDVSVELPVTTVPPAESLPSISHIRDQSIEKNNIAKGLHMLDDLAIRLQSREFE